jgi:succinyl-diaminopimelate desuccinylase
MTPNEVTDAAPTASIVELIRTLVRIPTRAGADSCQPAFAVLEDWFGAHGVKVERLPGAGGETLAVLARSPAAAEGPWYVLNATVDTAPFGDVSAWTHHPTGAEIDGGWMFGRGTADCKAGVALFAHLVAEAATRTDVQWPVAALFDADEHTGGFGGVRAFLADETLRRRTAGAFIGYPGPDKIVIGGRGFLRGVVHVAGEAAHSGSRRPAVANAISRAARLVTRLDTGPEGDTGSGDDPEFPLPAKVTVAGIAGGEGFSVVPDRCRVEVDVRLTPRFDAGVAEALLRRAAADVDREAPGPRPTEVEVVMSRPAYRLAAGSPLAGALQDGAAAALGRRPQLEIAGPSNVGNLLAEAGIEATAGFGVAYRGLHAVDEAIDLDTVDPVYRAYRGALERLARRAIG